MRPAASTTVRMCRWWRCSPHADVPVLQLSLPTLNPLALFELGQRLAPLREEGVLVVGSGFTTHNLAWFDPRQPADAPPPTASARFDT